ncbi:MAG: XdhC family protein [Polyangiaceae bacterium]|nr:XdhC family protein [Polyangiaceae bacterium]
MSIAQGILPRTAPPEEALGEALAALGRGSAAAIATVVSRQGSAPSTPGQKLALYRDGSRLLAVGTVGGGAVERAVMIAMHDALDAPTSEPRVHTFRLGPELGMCCGGSAEILIEVLRPRRAVLLVGAGHVGLATARVLGPLGFRVTVADARPEATEASRVSALESAGIRLVAADHDDPEVLEALAADPTQSAMVVMTHEHQLDQAVVEWAIRQRFAFVGGVGSRAKAVRTRQRLEAKGFAPELITSVRMPVGVSIGARTPEEIAVSIAGELVAWRSNMTKTSSRAPRATPAAREVPVPAKGEPS